MRRFALSVLAAFALLRFLSWKRTQAIPAAAPVAPPVPVAEPEPETDPRAEELRVKLESREEPVVEPEPDVAEPDERRRNVHERGRRAAEQMRDSTSGE